MGYLVRSAGIGEFSKAVISIWFRVPAASLTAARAQFDAATAVFPDTDFGLPGVIPLVTFGPNTEIYTIYDGSTAVISTGAMSPCVIGISCGNSNHDSAYRNTMYARMQYASGAPSVGPSRTVYNDFFQVGSRIAPSNSFAVSNAGSYIIVVADAWHHILVSLDLSGGCSSTYSTPDLTIDTTCPFYWAFDDANYNSAYLWPNTPQVVGNADVPNGIYSDRGNQNSGSFSFAAGNIPTGSKPIGIPSYSDFISKIYDVEMAELQIYTGVTLDTSVVMNRRAFVTSDGKPELDYSIPDALLGKSPEIRLHTGKNWKAGTNTGTLGNLTKVGTINDFSPGPDITP